MRSSIRTSSTPSRTVIVSMTDVLIAAKLVARGRDRMGRSFRRCGGSASPLKDGAKPMEQYDEELKNVRASLSD